MAKWAEIVRNLKALGYTEGLRTKEHTLYNCDCKDKSHPVGVINHPNNDSRPYGMKRQLGPHAKEYIKRFGKI